ncbi:MAG: type 2 isopentenyl-diphosphate Delta-isomerase [Chloroflexi bacterium]|nr:type 2 isopentenyl-diphosphate Delta-isomerase [Chloroflexota bacterium]
MKKVTHTSSRKIEHIDINLNKDVASTNTNGLDKFQFVHEALPEINLNEIDLSQNLFGRAVSAPILISSMTGGADEAKDINFILAEAAEEMGIAMGVGSQRAAIEEPSLAPTFNVRSVAPNILLFANLGAIQLNYGYGIDECQKAVDMIEADALILHLNPLQEAFQPEGDVNWHGILNKIEIICKKMPVPVIIKEVGWGISAKTAKKLSEIGIQAIDVAGAGGTSWSQVEMYRAKSENLARIAETFIGWGIPTADSIKQIRESLPEMKVIASGGLRSGLDIAKCIALGASMGGMAGPFLKAAIKSTSATVQEISNIQRTLQISMFAAGAKDLSVLQKTPLIKQ